MLKMEVYCHIYSSYALGFVCLKICLSNSQLSHVNKIRHVGKDRSMVALRLKS